MGRNEGDRIVAAQSSEWRNRSWKDCQCAEQCELSDEEARRFMLLAEQIGYPWYGKRVPLTTNR